MSLPVAMPPLSFRCSSFLVRYSLFDSRAMTADELLELEIEYTRFNAERTLGIDLASEFRTQRRGEVTALIDPARPRSALCNRVLRLAAADVGRLPELLELYRDHSIRPQFDIGPEDLCEEVASALSRSGFLPTQSLAYLTAEVAADPEPPPVCVERWEHDQADEFFALLSTSGVECDESIWRLRRRHYCTETFRTYVAIIEDEPRAWATLYVHGRAGYCANAYTQPGFRGHGCQRALLAARQADAAELGLRWLATDVLPNSISQRNCQRSGFQLATIQTHWREAAQRT